MDIPQTSRARAARHALEGIGKRSREAVFVISARTGRIALCNKAVERQFGHASRDLIGRSTEVLHPDKRSYERFCHSLEQAAYTSGVVVTHRSMRRHDGTELRARDRLISIEATGQPDLVLWLVRDSAESSVPVRSEIIERDLLRIAVSKHQAVHIWKAILERLALEFDWDYAEAWLHRSGPMVLTAWWCGARTPAMDHFTEVSRSIDFGPGEGLPGRVFRSGDIEWLGDVNEKPESVFRRSFIARSAGLRSWFAVPVGSSTPPSQVVLFACRTPRPFDHEVAALTREACHGIAAATGPGTPD